MTAGARMSMSTEQKLALIVAHSTYSMTTVRKWWKHESVRERTAHDLARVAKKLKLSRPRRNAT